MATQTEARKEGEGGAGRLAQVLNTGKMTPAEIRIFKMRQRMKQRHKTGKPSTIGGQKQEKPEEKAGPAGRPGVQRTGGPTRLNK